MSNSKKQKAEERLVFERFLSSCPNVLGVNPKPEYGDMPDVLIRYKSKTIGIELTEVISHPQERELASIKETIWQETKRKVARNGIKNLAADIDYSPILGPPNPHYRVSSPRGKKKSEIADNLAKQISQKAKSLSDGDRVDFKPVSFPEVRRIHLHRHSFKTTEDHLWKVYEYVWLNQQATVLLQETINGKHERYVKYLERCNECWLVLHINNAKDGQGVHIDAETMDNVYLADFDRVFYLDMIGRDSFELKLTKGNS